MPRRPLGVPVSGVLGPAARRLVPGTVTVRDGTPAPTIHQNRHRAT
ncbi:hypothetical protein STTU_1758 [Streptomyces sp. Tu6071]|nr:hypothetical protein STTU_1758 [Streptomyces sp. Tu6071]SCD76131.1 hypothetical protein GA0115252_11763 [Streptomyces sp. DfronAA-171]SCD95573.1 hypothetical protein GA0115251_13082 [Streptomyces sp. TverLS-915]